MRCVVGIVRNSQDGYAGKMQQTPLDEGTPMWVLLLANAVIAIVLSGFAWFVAWSGMAYGAGFITGMGVFFVYTRLKLGYWI